MIDFQHLTNIAIEAALAAGKIIQKYIDKDIDVATKIGGNTLASLVVTKVDTACEHIILEHLIPTCTTYDLGLLTEETEDNQSRFEKDYFWCVDPMDGTLAFINKHPGFSVAIALVSKEGIPYIGVVYNPSTNTIYTAIKDKGAFKNGKPWQLTQPKSFLTYVTDKTLSNSPNQDKIKDILHKKVKELGLQGYQEISGAGSVLNAMLVAENTPALLLKLPKEEQGGGSLWDFAATVCIFKELGLQATNFTGETLGLNAKESTFMNQLGICYASFKSD
ncbi:3'(2'),5'-bisphosphate nucleotidase CysQ family protein [Polaribacter aquimarinus]|uniref:3'(2'),5'-bisphosphate nucleotidase CysQ family protein n=1 Tax=Polaribacter aquimarinus TaxID=2100726 RepID=UPI001F1CC414|nr:inositol monophosphatase family protein [Polaribacter aquimarinus]